MVEKFESWLSKSIHPFTAVTLPLSRVMVSVWTTDRKSSVQGLHTSPVSFVDSCPNKHKHHHQCLLKVTKLIIEAVLTTIFITNFMITISVISILSADD